MSEETGAVLVVDDDRFILSSIASLLTKYGFNVTPCGDAAEAIERFKLGAYDAVLSDIKMPQINGLMLLERMRASDPNIPVLLMTAFADLDLALDAIKNGAFDFILKPYRTVHLLHSIRKAVRYKRLIEVERDYKAMLERTVRQRTSELADAMSMVNSLSDEVVQRLTAVAEHRDADTGSHIVRIGHYTRVISSALGMPEDFTETIAFASPMHDIGKIAIADSVLLKEGILTAEQFEVIKSHTIIGERILSNSSHPKLMVAASIALNHHECWDGSGYPGGLRGEGIPLEGRIVKICDQYDALVSKRPYKPAFTHREAVKIITRGDGKTLPSHFDPAVLEAFGRSEAEIAEVYRSLSDEPSLNPRG